MDRSIRCCHVQGCRVHRCLPYAAEELSTAGCQMVASPIDFQLVSAGASMRDASGPEGRCSPPAVQCGARVGVRKARGRQHAVLGLVSLGAAWAFKVNCQIGLRSLKLLCFWLSLRSLKFEIGISSNLGTMLYPFYFRFRL